MQCIGRYNSKKEMNHPIWTRWWIDFTILNYAVSTAEVVKYEVTMWIDKYLEVCDHNLFQRTIPAQPDFNASRGGKCSLQ